MPFGEREDSPAGGARVLARRAFGIRARDVQVDDVAAEELVADRTAHDVGLLILHGVCERPHPSTTVQSARAGWARMPHVIS